MTHAESTVARLYRDLVAALDLLAERDVTRARGIAKWISERTGSWAPPDHPGDVDDSPHWRRLTRPPPGAVRAGAAQCRAALRARKSRTEDRDQ